MPLHNFVNNGDAEKVIKGNNITLCFFDFGMSFFYNVSLLKDQRGNRGYFRREIEVVLLLILFS